MGKTPRTTGHAAGKTEDRIVLAERLRRQLELVSGGSSEDESLDEERTGEVSLATVYAEYINSMCKK